MYPKSAIIVGGSIAGLLHGLQLKRNGTDVVILEQDPSKDRHSHESGITIGPSVVSLLEKYDATGRPAAVCAGYMSLAWRQWLRVFNLASPRYMSNWGCLYLILRANFDGLPSEAVPAPPPAKKTDGAVEYCSGKRVVGVAYNPQTRTVSVEHADVGTGKVETRTAEVVLAADGVRSSVRQILGVPTRSQYAGYIAWRGTVPERLLSRETAEYFSNRLNFSLLGGTYFISYFIPTETGAVQPGDRLLNWVWYVVVPDGSAAMRDIFTDASGRTHASTIPQGMVDPQLWATQIARHRARMIPPIREIVSQTPRPFVTKVAEAQIRQAAWFDGRLVFVGDAFAAFRSHMGMATEQAARHCWQMDAVWRGRSSQEQRDREAVHYADRFVLLNRLVGLGGLGHWLAVLGTLATLIWVEAVHWSGRVVTRLSHAAGTGQG